MQYQNNDMDELFRQAAEAYPLNTGSANWDKVHAMLAGEEKQEQLPSKDHPLWLLLLLPFIMLGLPLNNNLITGRLQATTRIVIPAPEVQLPMNTGKARVVQSTTVGGRPRPAAKAPAVRHRQPVVAKSGRSQSFRLMTSQQQPLSLWTVNTEGKTEPLLAPSVSEDALTYQNKESLPASNNPQLPADAGESLAGKFPIDSIHQNLTGSDSRNGKKPVSWQKRFYAGVVAGPDMSTVKFQKFSSPGFQAGVLVGYAISNRFSVEAAALAVKKYYASDGEYYKTNGSYMPVNAKIITVDGNCRMIEIPVSLRYTFSQQKKHTWFATAGLSSYLMQREYYSLDYLYLSSGTVATYHRTYNDKDQYWLSNLQLSVGYSSDLGTLGNLRIEPYYLLPLKGMGHGGLPLSSMGIRVGITVPQF